MKPMNLQEEVMKLEEQESAINVACPMEDEASSTEGTPVGPGKDTHSTLVNE